MISDAPWNGICTTNLILVILEENTKILTSGKYRTLVLKYLSCMNPSANVCNNWFVTEDLSEKRKRLSFFFIAVERESVESSKMHSRCREVFRHFKPEGILEAHRGHHENYKTMIWDC